MTCPRLHLAREEAVGWRPVRGGGPSPGRPPRTGRLKPLASISSVHYFTSNLALGRWRVPTRRGIRGADLSATHGPGPPGAAAGPAATGRAAPHGQGGRR